ncbi:virulence RhuM family protein [Rhodoferax lacus]|uniref:virulence RhuM family protein n=1 Tax=Rhodoferax lacus TaxID=2184758 RepID=UPI0018F3C504|nr:RhuM family protein [Rhodoferax lacus]
MSALILYTAEDGRSQIKLRAKDQTVWLTQREMAELFDVSTDNVGLHLKNIFKDGELEEKSVTEESSVTAADGKNYLTKLYKLDAILAVGYRVRSPRGVQFRRWASTVLKEYLVEGFVMDDERMKNPDGRPDYFDAMLARIRDSEKRFLPKGARSDHLVQRLPATHPHRHHQPWADGSAHGGALHPVRPRPQTGGRQRG